VTRVRLEKGFHFTCGYSCKASTIENTYAKQGPSYCLAKVEPRPRSLLLRQGRWSGLVKILIRTTASTLVKKTPRKKILRQHKQGLHFLKKGPHMCIRECSGINISIVFATFLIDLKIFIADFQTSPSDKTTICP
jgi:hypothetical protein